MNWGRIYQTTTNICREIWELIRTSENPPCLLLPKSTPRNDMSKSSVFIIAKGWSRKGYVFYHTHYKYMTNGFASFTSDFLHRRKSEAQNLLNDKICWFSVNLFLFVFQLWALLHFIMPTLFDDHEEFNEWFSKDIESHAENKSGIDQSMFLHTTAPFL